jgi:hypothetical protein
MKTNLVALFLSEDFSPLPISRDCPATSPQWRQLAHGTLVLFSAVREAKSQEQTPSDEFYTTRSKSGSKHGSNMNGYPAQPQILSGSVGSMMASGQRTRNWPNTIQPIQNLSVGWEHPRPMRKAPTSQPSGGTPTAHVQDGPAQRWGAGWSEWRISPSNVLPLRISGGNVDESGDLLRLTCRSGTIRVIRTSSLIYEKKLGDSETKSCHDSCVRVEPPATPIADLFAVETPPQQRGWHMCHVGPT